MKAARIWRFGNCQITIGWLFHIHAWGVTFAWGRRDDAREFERLFEREIGVAFRAYDIECGLVQFWPASWLIDDGDFGAIGSRSWTGREFVFSRFAWPVFWSH